MKDELIPKSTLAKVLKTNERNPLVEIVQQVTRLKAINKLYAQVSDKRGEEFVDGLFDQLKVTTQFKKEQLDLIPKEGPLVVVCNHPFGALDGLMALKILLQVRSDIKVMANFILSEVKPISDYFLSVNPFESSNNGPALRDLIKFVIKSVNNDEFSKGIYMVFRAYIVNIKRYICVER
jgi:hypothetical protein